MKSLQLFFVLLPFFLSAQTDSLTHFSLAEKDILLEKHNLARTGVKKTPLLWSPQLEQEAQKQAEIIANNPTTYNHYCGFGRNIYFSTKRPTPSEVVNFWTKEQIYYHGDTITQKNLRIFGHYTQIIWQTTHTVGCAMYRNKTGLYVVVCLYSPKGNQIGQRP